MKQVGESIPLAHRQMRGKILVRCWLRDGANDKSKVEK